MPIAPVQIFRATPSNANVGSVSLIASGTTKGNSLVALAFVNDSVTLSVGGNVNGDYGAARETVDDSGFSHYLISAFVKQNIAGGTDVVTAGFGDSVLSTQYDLWVIEVGNCALSSFDVAKAGTPQPTPGTATDSVTTGNATNANQPALILGLGFVQAVQLTQGTGFTDQGVFTGSAAVGGTFRLQSKRITTTSAVAATWTPSHNNNALCVMVILDELVAVDVTQPIPDYGDRIVVPEYVFT